ncbi:hypothetical protein FDP41_013134 [Naegleria fowleri]|uniref:Uncharacterized protein n=1 Tax=Naegleria fowleri TaxID=5763 RepID=A0A6A5C129_NAEFO|nr:uncharacterized protein FDP41_013134 [Naegleria fowleri]KAF0980651.1 hypothetical protein FDP41_013134 [Naegleria fowleri]
MSAHRTSGQENDGEQNYRKAFFQPSSRMKFESYMTNSFDDENEDEYEQREYSEEQEQDDVEPSGEYESDRDGEYSDDYENNNNYNSNKYQYEEYELDEEDERLLREEMGGYSEHDGVDAHPEKEDSNTLTEQEQSFSEEELISKVSEINKLALRIDIIKRSLDESEESREQIEMLKSEMENIIATVCQIVKVERQVNQYVNNETTFSSSIIPLVRVLKEDIRKHFHSQQNYSKPIVELETSHTQLEENYDHKDQNMDQEESPQEEENGFISDEGEDPEEEEYQPTIDPEDLDGSDDCANILNLNFQELSYLENLQELCIKKSFNLIEERGKREKALLNYHLCELSYKETFRQEALSLVQQLIRNYENELDQLNKNCEQLKSEAKEIIHNTKRPYRNQKISTPQKLKIEKIEPLDTSSIITPRSTKEPRILTPSQVKEIQENKALQNMYNRLEASLSRTPKVDKEKESTKAPNQTKQVNLTSIHDPIESSDLKPKKLRSVSPETARKLAAERLKEKKQREKEQKEKEQQERAEKIKKLEEICQKQQALILREQKSANTKKYLEEILSFDSDEEEQMKQIEEIEKRKQEEEKINEARKKAILRAKEKKKKELEREKELEEERKRKEAEKWRKRDEALAAFKLKQEMEKEKGVHKEVAVMEATDTQQPTVAADRSKSKSTIPPSATTSTHLKKPTVTTKEEKKKKTSAPSSSTHSHLNQNNTKRKTTTSSNAVPTSPLLEGLDEGGEMDFLQFSPPPPMFSSKATTQVNKK